MFVWTIESVLAAIDAGIPEIISAYNNSFLFAIRKHFPMGPAYRFAFEATVDWLNRNETERLLIAGVDAAMSATAYAARQSDANPFDIYPDF